MLIRSCDRCGKQVQNRAMETKMWLCVSVYFRMTDEAATDLEYCPACSAIMLAKLNAMGIYLRNQPPAGPVDTPPPAHGLTPTATPVPTPTAKAMGDAPNS